MEEGRESRTRDQDKRSHHHPGNSSVGCVDTRQVGELQVREEDGGGHRERQGGGMKKKKKVERKEIKMEESGADVRYTCSREKEVMVTMQQPCVWCDGTSVVQTPPPH